MVLTMSWCLDQIGTFLKIIAPAVSEMQETELSRTEPLRNFFRNKRSFYSLDCECFSGTKVDDAYLTDKGQYIVVEFETSYLDASHDLLKLLWCAKVKYPCRDFLAILYTTWLENRSGPQQNVYPRLKEQIEELRKGFPFFLDMNIALVGCKAEKKLIYTFWSKGQKKATVDDAFFE